MTHRTNRVSKLSAVAALVLAALVGIVPLGPAFAQGGWWPWANQPSPAPRPPPTPREPVYRPPPGSPQPGAQPYAPPPATGTRSAICLQLEQRLVQEGQRGSLSREALPKIEAEMRNLDRTVRTGDAQLERTNCYEQWFFSRSVRKERRCIDLAAQVEAARRKLADLDAQRQQILGSRERSHQDEIIRELARNNCGATYQQEASRRGSNPFSSLWQDEDTGGPAGRGNGYNPLPFATYRTVCVRLCDGYFFPVSFATLENHFTRDADLCQSKCAAPAELFFYQNPGEGMEQARSVRARVPYTSLKTAFLYRKQYVQGCSCKQAEYTPTPGDRGDRRTEAPPQQAPVAAQTRPPRR